MRAKHIMEILSMSGSHSMPVFLELNCFPKFRQGHPKEAFKEAFNAGGLQKS